MMQSKHKITVILLLGLGCALLAGCTTYGVDNNTWKGMSPQERQIAMTQYYRQQARAQAQQAQIDKINAENAPINNAISALSGMAGNAASNSQRKCVTDNFAKTVCGYNCYIDQFGQGHCS